VGRISHELLRTEFPAPLASIKDQLVRSRQWEGELIHTSRDGSRVTVTSRWVVQADERGRRLATLETNKDITAQKRADAELRASEARYRRIFQAIAISIWEEDFSAVTASISHLKARGVTDFRNYLAEHPEFTRQAVGMVKVLDVNDASVELFGASDKRELLDSLNRIVLPETEGAFIEELVALAESRSTITSETVLQSLTGNRLNVLFTMTFPERPEIDSVLVSIVDITERKKAQEALEQAQAELAHANRVAALGELSASIVHEVSQPLAAVVINAGAATHWLNRNPPDLEEAQQAIGQIVEVGERASDILTKIRSFAKKTRVSMQAIDINQAVAGAIVLASNEVRRKGITLRTHLEDGLAPIMGDQIQLQQVMLNFILNAVDAMAEVEEDRRQLVVSTGCELDGIGVSVRDMGIGIDPDRADQLFEPFYTTKERGMGMGLSICRSIVEAHGGQVRALPNPDAGATFQFVLPASTGLDIATA
jgi:signal transduction histidine kinase